MNNKYSSIQLDEVLTPISRPERVDAEIAYPILGAHWYAQGLYIKETKLGSEIQADRLYRVEKGDFVYNRLFAWKGSFAVAKAKDHNCYVSNEFPMFIINENKIEAKYLELFFSRSSSWEDALGLSSGGTPTSRNRLKEAKLLSISIPLPPLEEQRRIVARIEVLAARIEEAKGLRREAVKEGEKVVISFLSETFDYASEVTLPSGWVWKSLAQLLDTNRGIATGPFGTLLQRADILAEGIPILGIPNVQANKFIPGFQDYISLEKAGELSTYQLQTDDLVIARSGTVGRSCILPGISPSPIMSTNLIRLRLDPKAFLPNLLCMLFNSSSLIERYKDEKCYGSTRTFFTQKMLLNLYLPVPPLDEQRRIVAYLDSLQAKIDTLKRKQAESETELNALLPSILDKAFKGEL